MLTEILSSERVAVAASGSTDIRSKDSALRALSELLARGREAGGPTAADYHRVLGDREALQSTGIGDGVAIPHGALEGLSAQVAAMLICPDGIAFDAIDGMPVGILFAVVGPKRNTGEHLKTLARISRLLRDGPFRKRLLSAEHGAEVFALVRAAEEARTSLPSI